MAGGSTGAAAAVGDVALGVGLVWVHGVTRLVRPVARGVLPLAAGLAVATRTAVPDQLLHAATDLRRRGAFARAELRGLAVAELDRLLPAAVESVLDRLDVTEQVLERVDLDRVAEGLDLDAAVARVDIAKVIDRIDLDGLVEERVDIDRVASRLDVDAVAARLDLAKVVDRLDLVGLAETVVDGIDLPRIIRESTGSVASEGLRGVRTRSMEADQGLSHLMDRVLPGRRPAPAPAGGTGGS